MFAIPVLFSNKNSFSCECRVQVSSSTCSGDFESDILCSHLLQLMFRRH